MPSKVEVDISVKADVAKVSVDDTRAKLSDGEGTVNVKPGNHSLTWAVRGAAGTTYKAGQKRFRDLRRTVNPGTVFLAGASAQIAPENFSYLNETNLSEGKARHVSWSVGGMGGVLFPNSIMVAVNYKRQVVYAANDETQVCSPIGLLSSLNCSPQIIGPPADPTRSNQTGVEVRKIFNQYFAISPRLTRDWTHQSTGVELPLFFFRDSTGGLNGGVSLGWRSDTKAFTASVFIGQVLGVIAK
jgi:hypothetical protein